MSKKGKLILAWLLLGCFLLLSFLTTAGKMTIFDRGATASFQSLIPRSWDTFLSIFSLLGIFEIATAIVAASGFFVLKKDRKIWWGLIFFAVLLALELAGKSLVYQPKPPLSLLRYHLPFSVSAVSVYTSYSFPSGHISRTAFLTVLGFFLAKKFLANRFQRKLAYAGSLLFLLLMMISRVYLGEHWGTDVLGGLFLGLSMGLFALVYY